MRRNNWLFADSLRAGQHATAVMSLIQSAKLNARDPYASLKDVLTRPPTHNNSKIEELLPHRWQPGRLRAAHFSRTPPSGRNPPQAAWLALSASVVNESA